MKRIAVPLVNGKLSEFFGNCNHYEIFEVEGEHILSREIIASPNKEITLLPLWASSQGITDVITFKVDVRIMELFTSYKINLYVGINNESPEDIIQDYINGTLKSDEKIISEIYEKV
jgi:predicted Fe-Mo cluster-binding NifX family protein